jgi:hypothetical protein
MEPAAFAAAVAASFRAAEPVSEDVVQARFRRGHGYRDLRGMLRKADLAPDARVLAIGCGKGLAGRSAAYTAVVTREVYPTAAVEQVNYELGVENAPGAAYDMVVTHSLLHFVFDIAPLCGIVCRAMAQAGCYLMANEPNARFWSNSECVGELERVSAIEGRRRHLLKYAEPARYWAKLMQAVRPPGGRDLAAEVNRLLRERLGMKGELTTREILRIADPHVRDQTPGVYRLGSDGLDWDELGSGPLAGLRVEAVRTSGYVMRDNPARVPERWRQLDRELAERSPLDGMSFTALWRRLP